MHLLALLLACDPSPSEKPAPELEDSGVEAVPPTLSVEALDESALGELADEALAVSPLWLRPDLELAFRRLEADTRDELAALIVDLDDPWLTDELGFTIAHLSPETLSDEDFDPGLLLENATWIRDVDADLAYVELVDAGEPGVDEDYSTTARYQVEVGGELTTVDLPAEHYYWYIVHPRVEDEHPLYIDAWESCRRRSLECPTTSEEGAFWREFLWEGAATDCPEGEWCPVLSDAMGEATYLWSDAGGGVGAVGAIASFMLSSDESYGRWLSFGAGSERSVQPNRIYGLGAGNCGEWADMTTALSRTALIPTYNVVPASWDHTWNAFYDPHSERWVRWEPVNWWFDHDYGAPYANHATRGDARVLMVTEDDTDSWFTMQVVVTDAAGAPVDGALVSIWSPYDAYWWYAGEQSTDSTGTASFTLTADQEFAFRVDSAIGGYPEDSSTITYGSSGVAAGETDVIEVSVSGTLPAPTERAGAPVDYSATLVLTLAGQSAEGRVLAESLAYGPDTFTVEDAAPTLRWFLLPESAYEAWLAGEAVDALQEGVLGEAERLGANDGDVLVLVNEDTLSTAAIGALEASLEAVDEAGEPIAGAEPLVWSASLVLLPGEHRAWRLGREG